MLMCGSAANAYSHGISEEILGKAIKQYNLPRGKIVVATKVFLLCAEDNVELASIGKGQDWIEQEAGYVNGNGLSRKHIFDSVDASLRRLGLDYIDLLQIHRYYFCEQLKCCLELELINF
jgi:aryl-alcohol dehydrogenase-like predicted oxidoreductase